MGTQKAALILESYPYGALGAHKAVPEWVLKWRAWHGEVLFRCLGPRVAYGCFR